MKIRTKRWRTTCKSRALRDFPGASAHTFYKMMNRIESYLLCGNRAHDLVGFDEKENVLKIWIRPMPLGQRETQEEIKGYVFRNYRRKYRELMLVPGEELELYLPFIGGNSHQDAEMKREYFCLNFGDFEIGFWSDWPEKMEIEPGACGQLRFAPRHS